MLRYVLEPGASQRPESTEAVKRDATETLEALRATTIGAEHEVQTPFGSRRVLYADYTATGRASTLVEDFVRDKVLPCYGNTHTLTSATARHTTYLVAEAREVIRHHLNASHEDAVIFAGNGSTGVANLLVQAFQRAAFDVGGSHGMAVGQCRDMYYKEDRWGSGECTLCGVRVKNAKVYQAHQLSEAHRARLRASEEGSSGCQPCCPQIPHRRVVVIADPVLHHSTLLPFRELLPLNPLVGQAVLGSFSGAHWRAAKPSGNCRNEEDDAKAVAQADSSDLRSTSPVEMELSSLPINNLTGLLDESEFQKRLEALRSWQECHPTETELVVICVLAAASNITGLCADVARLTSLARTTLPGIIVCWDFASAAGHQPCDLNPPGDASSSVDAAFFSPHKLWGGPSSVGVLAVKKRLLCNAVPALPGGGVVFYVSEGGHSYIQNSEEREEAGTPNIVGCIRAGLAFHLQDQIPSGAVVAREEAMRHRALGAWGAHPRIDILGPIAAHGANTLSRTGIVSFMIRYGNEKPGLYLHYHFVAALLNDLFGVQARGGCACAGPYAQWLLGVGPELSVDFEQCLQRSAQEVFRPGFVRVGFHWAMSDDDFEALVAAVLWVADKGWRLLAAYTFDRETGEWLHRLDVPQRRRVWLSSLRVQDTASPIAQLESTLGIGVSASQPSAPRGAEALMASADFALREAYSSAQVALSSSKWPVLDPSFAHLLWFAVPADVAFTLRSARPDRPQLVPGEDVFAAMEGSWVRPSHAVLDARIHRSDAMSVQLLAEQSIVEAASAPTLSPEELVPAPTGLVFAKRLLKPKIPKQMRGLIGKAIGDFDMVKDGDRVLVGLSGGKDSLAVLHVLLALRRSAPIRFDVAAATVDPQTPEYNPSPLVPYLKAMGVEYHMLSKPIIEMAKVHIDPKKPSICAFCSRMKRGLLYSCMREHGYNVLVLGQHLDDFAESFFMSAIHNGLLRTMKANYWVKQEDVRVCRPLLYVREAQTALFAKENGLPVIADNCPACFSAPKERHKTKLLLSSLEFDYPQLFSTLLRAMRPLYALGTADKANDGASRYVGVEDEDEEPRPRQQVVGDSGARAKGGASSCSIQPAPPDASEEDFHAEIALTACGPRLPCDVDDNTANGTTDARVGEVGKFIPAAEITKPMPQASEYDAGALQAATPVWAAGAGFAIGMGVGVLLTMRLLRR